MAVRIVTDSTADLPATLAAGLGIVVVPLHIYFRDQVFRDGDDLSHEEFYRRLTSDDAVYPRTAAPSSADFAAAYDALSGDADGIVSVHLSSKLSATYHAAALAASESARACRIEVIDSTNVSLALGLLVIQAAQQALDRADLDEVVQSTLAAIPRLRFFGALDTLEYLYRGGRIGRASAFLGSVLNIKPVIGLSDGVAYPIERVRGRERALRRVCALIGNSGPIERIAVGHTTDEVSMESLANCATRFAPGPSIVRAQCGATLGTYLGPRAFGTGMILGQS